MKQVIIAGNIGRDAEVRTTQNGDKVTSFAVAVSGFRKADPTTWFDCSIWGNRGEKVAGYIRKGGKTYSGGKVVNPGFAPPIKRYRSKWGNQRVR